MALVSYLRFPHDLVYLHDFYFLFEGVICSEYYHTYQLSIRGSRRKYIFYFQNGRFFWIWHTLFNINQYKNVENLYILFKNSNTEYNEKNDKLAFLRPWPKKN